MKRYDVYAKGFKIGTVQARNIADAQRIAQEKYRAEFARAGYIAFEIYLVN